MDRYALTVTTAPAAEPVTLSEAKIQLRVDGSDEDANISRLILSAREFVEGTTGRALVTATYAATYDGFPFGRGGFIPPRTPVASVVSVAYRDTAGDSQTFASSNYRLSLGGVYTPARVELVDGGSWPTTDGEVDGVVVTFTAGTAADLVPEAIRHEVLMLVGFWFKRPECEGQPVRGFDQAFRMLHDFNSVPHLA